jgi:hypothetical protein
MPRAMQRPPWRIIGDSFSLVLATPGDPRHVDAARLDAREAAWLVSKLGGPAGWSVAAGALIDAARYVRARHAVRLGVRGDDPRRVVVAALLRGLLVGWRVERLHRATRGGDGAEDGDDVIAHGDLLRKTWIELELLDMDGNPVPGEAYWIKLPDGTVREGALDQQGRAYFDNLDPGEAEIRWPNRDGDATMEGRGPGQGALQEASEGVSGAPSSVESTWVEIELLDMVGQPVAFERYWIKLPDGTVREGALDAMGLAYFDGLNPGQCTIRWLGRDEEAAFLEPDVTAPGATDLVAQQVEALESAARDGTPFCEECERARRQELAEAQA